MGLFRGILFCYTGLIMLWGFLGRVWFCNGLFERAWLCNVVFLGGLAFVMGLFFLMGLS